MEYPELPTQIVTDIKYTLALVLAGGRGTRLKDLTRWRVKPAVPFGGEYRIVDFALSNCINSGVRKIGVLTQYKSQSLIRHIIHGWGVLHAELGEFIEILPAQQRIAEKWYSGTADAVYQNIDIVRRYNPDYVLLLAGDHIYKMDYSPLISYHRLRKSDLTISCIEIPVELASEFGVMQVDDEQRVVGFEEKPNSPKPIPGTRDRALASMGIYVFDTAFLFEQLILDADDANSSHDFGKDIIPSLIQSHRVFACPFQSVGGGQYWRDVGTLDAYWQTNMELVGEAPELKLHDRKWPIRTNSRQYPPAKFIFNEAHRRGLAVDSLVTNGSIISGGYVENSLLFYDVRIEEQAEVRQSVILPEVVIGSKCRIRKAIIDKGCKVPSGTVIGEDPAEDWERFHVSPGGVVLATPEMFGQMIHKVR
ncbi:glucose-1-phosphate adenylyltransferase [Bythopirellula polymerisocia]|uniref:Glucose-1-phosphate adenylyltransferase n=1 Tax=Bythopirellula polymerisocia TaxID=2528003 RepID=A0A5C6CUY3_9BACT|nr:glucose-1-phosphate adenylyltransferase [Bythopirellula polymerisocia]TWU28390.1 Glucose-1-phosphate adenylyltransferase [Bythopirellula polymerisocia]